MSRPKKIGDMMKDKKPNFHRAFSLFIEKKRRKLGYLLHHVLSLETVWKRRRKEIPQVAETIDVSPGFLSLFQTSKDRLMKIRKKNPERG